MASMFPQTTPCLDPCLLLTGPWLMCSAPTGSPQSRTARIGSVTPVSVGSAMALGWNAQQLQQPKGSQSRYIVSDKTSYIHNNWHIVIVTKTSCQLHWGAQWRYIYTPVPTIQSPWPPTSNMMNLRQYNSVRDQSREASLYIDMLILETPSFCLSACTNKSVNYCKSVIHSKSQIFLANTFF